MDEQHIHQRIGQILYNSGPIDAQKTIVMAELFAENNGAQIWDTHLFEQGVA